MRYRRQRPADRLAAGCRTSSTTRSWRSRERQRHSSARQSWSHPPPGTAAARLATSSRI